MAEEKTDVVIVGGGQAGLAASRHLSAHRIAHIVLERGRVAERWRSERWDSLVANGPAWHDRFPDMEFSGVHPDAFATKNDVAAYFETYARMNKAPVRTGVAALSARRNEGGAGFRVETSDGVIDAASVVAATGPFQKPVIPPLIPDSGRIHQLHSSTYRNPDQLPDGGVLVVGAGSSGVQIADELMRAGRRVYLSVGPHNRPPRRYRGFDFVWWLGILGKWEAQFAEPGKEHVTIAVSGAHGGHTVDFRDLANRGMTLVGMTTGYEAGVVGFANDLAANVAQGDADYLSILDEADAYAGRNGLDLPKDPDAREIGPDPECVANPVSSLDLAEAGVRTVLWATGYAFDFGWLQVNAFDESGKPEHRRGVSPEPGVYFVGLPWLSRRGSSFIWGVWHDARFIADQIAIQRNYQSHLRSKS